AKCAPKRTADPRRHRLQSRPGPPRAAPSRPGPSHAVGAPGSSWSCAFGCKALRPRFFSRFFSLDNFPLLNAWRAGTECRAPAVANPTSTKDTAMKLHVLTAALLGALALSACQNDTADSAMTSEADADTAAMADTTPVVEDATTSADATAAMDATAGATASGDIVDAAIASPDHTTLVAAVQAAGLVDTLKGAGPFTVFAPSNAAFEKLPAGTVEGL